MSVASVIAFIFFVMIMLTVTSLFGLLVMKIASEEELDYVKSANWNCESNAEFSEKYKPFYCDYIESVFKKYDFDYNVIVNKGGINDKLEICYYDDNNTFQFLFYPGDLYADIDVNYYFFSNDEKTLKDYSKQQKCVQLLDEIIDYCAYDAKTDEEPFDRLFYKSVEGDGGARYTYHFDNYCGYVGYSVHIINASPYYYRM